MRRPLRLIVYSSCLTLPRDEDCPRLKVTEVTGANVAIDKYMLNCFKVIQVEKSFINLKLLVRTYKEFYFN